MKRIKLFIILITITSCSAFSQNQKVIKCLEDKMDIKEKDKAKKTFKSIKLFEQFLIENHFLESNDKQGYLDMVKKMENNKYSYKEKLRRTYKNLDLENYLDAEFLFYYKKCIYMILEKDKNSKTLTSYLNQFEKVETSGYDNIKDLEELIRHTNFKNEKSRLIITGIFYTYFF